MLGCQNLQYRFSKRLLALCLLINSHNKSIKILGAPFIYIKFTKKSMKILITGASGLIGKALVGALQQVGHQVVTLSTRKQTSSLTTYYWNPEKGEIDTKALVDVDVIISLAGAKINQRWTAKNKKAILNSRVLGTKLLRKAIQNNTSHNISHFISASAVGLYPSHINELYHEDETKIADSFTGTVVSAWEQEVAAFEHTVAHVSKIRIGLVLAKTGGALLPLAIPASFGFGAWFGSGKQWQSWIHIQDLVRLFVFTIDNPGCYNGVSPEPVTQKSLVKAISKQYGMPQWLPGIPAVIINVFLGEMATILFDSIRASSTAAQTRGFSFQFSTLNQALADLLPLRSKK